MSEGHIKMCTSSLEIAGLDITTIRYRLHLIEWPKMDMLEKLIAVKTWHEFLRPIEEE